MTVMANTDDSDRADAIFQSKKRWDAHLKKLRRKMQIDAEKPLTRDQQIVEDVLQIICGATVIEANIERPIDRTDIEGSLYHMRRAIEAAQRIRVRALRQLISALRKTTRNLPENMRPPGLGLALYHAEAYTPEFRRNIRKAFPQASLPEYKPHPDAFEKRLAAEFALDLCERFRVPVTTTREGKFCLIAAALYGNPDADLQYHCRQALNKKPGAE